MASSEAYDFSLFEPQVTTARATSATKTKSTNSYVRGSAAPQRTAPQRKPQPKPSPKKAPAKKAATSILSSLEIVPERNSQSVSLSSSVIKAMAIFGVFCIAVVGLLTMRAQNETLINQISNINDEIAIAEGEKVRLTAELNSKYSSDKIDSYAVNTLGMVKAEGSQVSYIDLSEGDEIVFSGDKTVSNKAFMLKVKDFFAYIF